MCRYYVTVILASYIPMPFPGGGGGGGEKRPGGRGKKYTLK